MLCPIMLAFMLAATGCFAPIKLPIAEFTWSHETVFDVLFDATSSDGGDSVVVSWEWTFGDGESSTGVTVRHTYTTPGDYTVELTVTDERGFKASKRHTVHAIRELLVPEEFWTIQEAIDDGGAGDIVIVSPGRYWENFTFRGKAVCVRSVAPNDPNIVASTIIEPGILAGGLRGNTFVNHLAGSSGAALYLVDSAAIVTDNQFDDNTCDPLQVGDPTSIWSPGGYDSQGGAIKVLCTSKAPTILDNEFHNNTAIAGGAIYVAVGSTGSGNAVARVKIQGNTFISNRASGNYSPHNQTTDVGGAIQAEYESLIDLGPGDTNSYSQNLPHDVYYDYGLASPARSCPLTVWGQTD